MPDPSDNYLAIKELMTRSTPKPMLAKYDRDGDGNPDGGSRKMWPMVLGSSQTPDLPEETTEMVLCYQTTGGVGWRCFKVALLSDIRETTPNQAKPPMDEDQVRRQSCVVNVDLPQFPR